MLAEIDELGISRSELAARSGLARETLSRWAHGATQPTLEALEQLVAAAGYSAELVLTPADPGDVGLALDQLALTHEHRYSSLLGSRWPAARSSLRAAAALYGHGVLVGPMAATFHGAPARPNDGAVDLLVAPETYLQIGDLMLDRDVLAEGRERCGGEVRTRWGTPEGGLLRTRSTAGDMEPGLVRARAHHAQVDGVGALRVARVEDLLQIAATSAWSEDLPTSPGLRAVLATSRYSTRAPELQAPLASG